MGHSSDPSSPAKPTPDKGTACACSGGIIVAAALAGLGSQFACTIGWHLRGLAPQPVLAVRVVPDGQFLPATPLVPFRFGAQRNGTLRQLSPRRTWTRSRCWIPCLSGPLIPDKCRLGDGGEAPGPGRPRLPLLPGALLSVSGQEAERVCDGGAAAGVPRWVGPPDSGLPRDDGHPPPPSSRSSISW